MGRFAFATVFGPSVASDLDIDCSFVTQVDKTENTDQDATTACVDKHFAGGDNEV